MKNTTLIIFSLPIFCLFLLFSCWWNDTDSQKENINKEKYSSIEIYECSDDNLKEKCNLLKGETNIQNVLQVNEKVCNIPSIINKDDYDKIFLDYKIWTDKISNINLSNNDNIRELKFTYEKKEEWKEIKWKDINIMFDLTYFSLNEEIENDVIMNRKKFLTNFVENGINNISLEYWDKVNLYYIWTIDYWNYPEHKNYALNDTNNFVLKKWIEKIRWDYHIKYECSYNKRKWKIKFYYKNYQKNIVNNNTEENNNNNNISTKEKLLEAMLKLIDNKYNSWEYNKWTFLLESLDKNTGFLNAENSINILISDFVFQLHPKMKENKNIPITSEKYDFITKNLSLLNEEWYFYDFYKNYVAKNYLQDKCKKNESLYLVWFNLDDDLDIKRIKKDYYKDYLFKWCNIYFE